MTSDITRTMRNKLERKKTRKKKGKKTWTRTKICNNIHVLQKQHRYNLYFVFLNRIIICSCWKIEHAQMSNTTVRSNYLLDESCVATWMVSKVHITMINGIITWEGKKDNLKKLNQRQSTWNQSFPLVHTFTRWWWEAIGL